MALIANYPFFPGQGGQILEESVGNADATLTFSPAVWGTFSNGVPNVNFLSATQQAATVTNAIFLELDNTAWSIAFWYQANGTGSQTHFATIVSGVSGGMLLDMNQVAGSLRLLIGNAAFGGRTATTPSVAMNDGALHFIVVTYAGGAAGAIQFYIDGATVVTTPAGTVPATGWSGQLQIGRLSAALGRYTNGRMGGIQIYNHELTQGEVTALFQNPQIPKGGFSLMLAALLDL